MTQLFGHRWKDDVIKTIFRKRVQFGGVFWHIDQLNHTFAEINENYEEVSNFIIQHIDLDHDLLLYLQPQIITGVSITPIVDGPDASDSMIQLIKQAKRFIHFSVMLFFNDEEGQRITEALVEAAARGVTVRLMVDNVTTLIGNDPSVPLPLWDKFERGVFDVLEKKCIMLE